MSYRASRRRAFTLIELLIVVSVIALLIAVLLPALGSAKETARRAMCASNLRQWAIVAGSYQPDNRGYYPGVVAWGLNDLWTEGYTYVGPGNTWQGQQTQRKMMDYGMAKSITWCPSRQQARNYWYDLFPGGWTATDYFTFMGRGDRAPYVPPYGSNVFGDSLEIEGWTNSGYYWNFSNGNATRAPVWNEKLQRSRRTVLAYDRSWTEINANRVYNDNPGYDGQSNHARLGGAPVYAAGANYLLIDGSVHWDNLSEQSYFYGGAYAAGDYYRTFIVGAKLRGP